MSNVGGIDRLFRILIGLGLISLVFFGEYIIGKNLVYGWIGILPLATGLFRFCPAYTLFGFKTCKLK